MYIGCPFLKPALILTSVSTEVEKPKGDGSYIEKPIVFGNLFKKYIVFLNLVAYKTVKCINWQ